MADAFDYDKFYCALCSLKLHNDNDAKLHYVGKKHQKSIDSERKRQDLESRSVFVYGFPANSLTKQEISDYFENNFGRVQNVRMNESKNSSAIVEFFDEKIATNVVLLKKHKINNQSTVVKSSVIQNKPKQTNKQDTSAEAASAETSISSGASSAHIDDENVFKNVEQMINLHHRLALDTEEFESRLSIARNIEETFGNFISGPFSVKLYGSSSNGLGWKKSDVDLTLRLEKCSIYGDNNNKPVRTGAYLLSRDADELRLENRLTYNELQSLNLVERMTIVKKCLASSDAVRKIVEIAGNRCPLLKFLFNQHVKCELTFDNALALNNTEWIKFLVTICPPLPILTSILKYWSIKLDLMSTSPYNFGGYTLALMLITFLQAKRLLPPVVISGSQGILINDKSTYIEGWNCYWNGEGSSHLFDPILAVDLLKEFFNFLSQQNLSYVVFLPRYGVIASLEKFMESYYYIEEMEADNRAPLVFSNLNVQDPFVLNHNVAAKINARTVDNFKFKASQIASACKSGQSFPEAFTTSLHESSAIETAEQNFQSVVVNGVSTYSLTIHPSVNDINKFFKSWRYNFNTTWLEQTKNAAHAILCKLLLIELVSATRPAENGADSPPVEKRRRKIDDKIVENFNCSAPYPVWLGRKRFQTKGNDDSVGRSLEIEAEISQKIVEESISRETLSKPLNFNLSLEWTTDEETGVPFVAFIFTTSDADQFGQFTTFCTFFRSFFRKCLPLYLHH